MVTDGGRYRLPVGARPECAWSAVRANGRLNARYHRLVRRFGGYRNPAAKKRAIVAIAHTLAVVIWHMLATGTPYTDLGPTSTPVAATPPMKPSGSSPNSKPSATRSPWPPPPETPGSRTRPRCAPPGAAAPSAEASLVLVEILTAGSANIRFASIAPPMHPATW